MNSIMNIKDLQDQEQRKDIESLFERLKIQLDKFMLPIESLNVLLHDNYVEVQFPFDSQIMLEDLIDQLSRDKEFHVLVASKSESEKDFRAVLYTTPYEHNMFVLTMTSHEYGVINDVVAKVYDDIESMYLSLRNELVIGESAGITIEAQKLSDVIKVFYK